MGKLQRASLKDPVKVEVSSRYQTVDKLKQYYLFIPQKYKVRYKLTLSIFESDSEGTVQNRVLFYWYTVLTNVIENFCTKIHEITQ